MTTEQKTAGSRPYLECTEDERAGYAYLVILPDVARKVGRAFRVPDWDALQGAMVIPLVKALRDPTCNTWPILRYRMEMAAKDEAEKIKRYERFKCKYRKEMREKYAQHLES